MKGGRASSGTCTLIGRQPRAAAAEGDGVAPPSSANGPLLGLGSRLLLTPRHGGLLLQSQPCTAATSAAVLAASLQTGQTEMQTRHALRIKVPNSVADGLTRHKHKTSLGFKVGQESCGSVLL